MAVSDPMSPSDCTEEPDIARARTLPVWIGRRAARHPDRPAVMFLEDDGGQQQWSYGELWARACDVAERLPEVAEAQPRAVLLFPPGLEFLAGFIGCQIAGWVPVPTCYPKPGREMPRLDSAANDCQPAALVGDAATLGSIDPGKLSAAVRDLPRVATDTGRRRVMVRDPESLTLSPDSLALLQYTSGSTSEPKGVMVRHRNLMANLEAIRLRFQARWQPEDASEPDYGVFWLPFFHDMGLIGGILSPLYIGGCTILMSPRSFLQRPLRWLQSISDHRAVISGAPNFAYQLCVDRIAPDQTDRLDLSCWKTAFCGAEPILPRTLLDFAARFSACGFSESSFYPCYGLAEATLLAAGGDGPGKPEIIAVSREALGEGRAAIHPQGRGRDYQRLVRCGGPVSDTTLRIVDPETRQVVDDRIVGEIWLRGPGVTSGYWNRAEENADQFDARLASGDSGFCRTGDLGFLHQGGLYVTGRRKDLIILRGRNHFPQDIEATVKRMLGSEAGQCAAFAVAGPRGEALAIVAELPRRFDESRCPDLVRSLRRVVIEVHEVDPRHVLLVRQATVPLTSSGKVQRSRCRELFEANEIRHKYRYDRASGSEQSPLAIPELPTSPNREDLHAIAESVEGWLAEWLVVRAGVPPEEIELDKPFADYGVDSMTAVELSGELEDWSGIELTPVVAWNYPTVSRISRYVAEQVVGPPDLPTPSSDLNESELEGLLDEIEQLSDSEINHALADKRRP